jgi:hypothetical protein
MIINTKPKTKIEIFKSLLKKYEMQLLIQHQQL